MTRSAPSSPPKNGNGNGAAPPTREQRILIADDDTLVSDPLRKILIMHGYRADCVETGWDAVAALLTGKYDLLVSDICMPGNMALDVLHNPEVVALNLPVILITGFPSMDTSIEALRLSVADYFIKPVSVKPFLESVRKALTKAPKNSAVSEIEARLAGVSNLLESVKQSFAAVAHAQHDGDAPSDPEERLLKARLSLQEFSELSRRERQIVGCVARGQEPAAIAQQLEISVSTVRNHLKSIYRKVGVGSQVALVRKLLSTGKGEEPREPA